MKSRKNIITVTLLFGGGLFLSILVFLGLFLSSHKAVTGTLTIFPPNCILYIESYDLTIVGSDSKGVTYLCLPTYCNVDSIVQNVNNSQAVLFDEEGNILTDPKIGIIQEVSVYTGNGEYVPWKICFMRSENLASMFITLPDYGLEDIQHHTLSDAHIQVYDEDGYLTISDDDIQIKGHGNGTWDEIKRSYELRFIDKQSVCGLPASKRWTLLANNDTEMAYKMGLDLARMLDMEYVIYSEYLDLYVNGKYIGNYLLCKEPHIGVDDLNINDLQEQNKIYNESAVPFLTPEAKGFINTGNPDDISGGYLVEKTMASPEEISKPVAFHLTHNNYSIKSPRNASKEEIAYIADFFDRVDSIIYKQGNDQLEMIDLYSFSRGYLIEEFMFNADAEVASRFFYKKEGQDILYAGPVWDMEASCGESTHYDGYFLGYDNSIKDCELYLPDYKEPLMWDKLLLENPEYREYTGEVFNEYLTVFYEIVNSYIDNCYDKIHASVEMDRAIYGYSNGGIGHYKSYENTIRFTKFWLYNRIYYMMELLGVKGEIPKRGFSDGTEHTLSFMFPDGRVEVLTVKDG